MQYISNIGAAAVSSPGPMSLRVVAGWRNAGQFQESYGVVFMSRIIRVLLSGPACKQDPVKLQLIWYIADLLLQVLNMPKF